VAGRRGDAQPDGLFGNLMGARGSCRTPSRWRVLTRSTPTRLPSSTAPAGGRRHLPRPAAATGIRTHPACRGPPDDARIAVIVEPTATRATVLLMLAAHGLTTREAEVARLVLRGTSTCAIADALHISGHTVQDHLKAVSTRSGRAVAAIWSPACSACAPITRLRRTSSSAGLRTRPPARRPPTPRRRSSASACCPTAGRSPR